VIEPVDYLFLEIGLPYAANSVVTIIFLSTLPSIGYVNGLETASAPFLAINASSLLSSVAPLGLTFESFLVAGKSESIYCCCWEWLCLTRFKG